MIQRPTRPTDQDILDAIRSGDSNLTVLITDRLRPEHGDVPVAWVRGRLHRLEADGYVTRAETVYKTQINWKVAPV